MVYIFLSSYNCLVSILIMIFSPSHSPTNQLLQFTNPWSYVAATEASSALLPQVVYYSGTPLNGHPSTADTHDITLKVSTVIPFTLVLKQPLNHKHPATPYNGVFAVPIVREQYFTTPI